MILETERLYLREMEQTDFEALCKIMQDKDTPLACIFYKIIPVWKL